MQSPSLKDAHKSNSAHTTAVLPLPSSSTPQQQQEQRISSSSPAVRFPFAAAAAVVVSCLASTVGSQLSNIAVSSALPPTYSVPPTSASSSFDDGDDACHNKKDARSLPRHDDYQQQGNANEGGDGDEDGGFYYDYAYHDYEDFDGRCKNQGHGSYSYTFSSYQQEKNPSFSSKKTNNNAHHQRHQHQQKDKHQNYLFSILRDSLLREDNGQSNGGRRGGRGEKGEGGAEEGDCGGENTFYGRLPPTAGAQYCHHDDAHHHGQRWQSVDENENTDTNNNNNNDAFDANNNNNNVFSSIDYYEAQFEAIDSAIRSHSKRSRQQQQQQQKRKRGGGDGAANKDQEEKRWDTADAANPFDQHHHENCHPTGISPSSTDADIHPTDKNDDLGGADGGADNTCGDEGLPDHVDDENESQNGRDAAGDDDGCHNADDQNCPQTDDEGDCDDNDDTEQTKKKKRKGCKGKGNRKGRKTNKAQKKKRKAGLDGFETDTDAEDENDEDENVEADKDRYQNEREDQEESDEEEQQQFAHSASTAAAKNISGTASSVAEIHAKARKFMEKTMRGPFCSVTLAYDYGDNYHSGVSCEEEEKRGTISGRYNDNDGNKSHYGNEVPFYQIAIPSTTAPRVSARNQNGHVEMMSRKEASSSSSVVGMGNDHNVTMASSSPVTHRETEEKADSFESTKAIELFAPPLTKAEQHHQQQQQVDDATDNTCNDDDVEAQQQKQHQHVRVIAVATLNGVSVRRIVVGGSSSSSTPTVAVGIPSTPSRRGTSNTTMRSHEQNAHMSSILHASTSSKSSSTSAAEALQDVANSILLFSSSSSSPSAPFSTSALAKKGAAAVLLPMLNDLLMEKSTGDDAKESESTKKEQLSALASTMSQASPTHNAAIISNSNTAEHQHEDLHLQQQYQQRQPEEKNEEKNEEKERRHTPSLSLKTPQGMTLFEFQSPFRVKGTIIMNEEATTTTLSTTANDDTRMNNNNNNDEGNKKGRVGGGVASSPNNSNKKAVSVIHLKFVATERLPNSLTLSAPPATTTTTGNNAAGSSSGGGGGGIAPSSVSVPSLSIGQRGGGGGDDGPVPLSSSSSSSQKGMSRAEKQRARAQRRRAEAVSSTTRASLLKDETEESGGNAFTTETESNTRGTDTPLSDATCRTSSFSSTASLVPPIIAPAPSEEVLRMQVPLGTDVPASSRRVFIGQVPKRNVEKTMLTWLSFVAPTLIVRRVQPMTKSTSIALPSHFAGGKKIVHNHNNNQKRTQHTITEQQTVNPSCSSSSAPSKQDQPSSFSPPLLYTGGTSVYFEDQSHADAALTLHKRSFFDVITVNDADGSMISSLFSPQQATNTNTTTTTTTTSSSSSSSSSTTRPQQTVAAVTKKGSKKGGGVLLSSGTAAINPTVSYSSSSSSWLGFWTIDWDEVARSDEINVADDAEHLREEQQQQQRFVKEFASLRQQDTFRTQFKHWVCLNEINVEIPQNQERTRNGVVNINNNTNNNNNNIVNNKSNASFSSIGLIQKADQNEKRECNSCVGTTNDGVSAQQQQFNKRLQQQQHHEQGATSCAQQFASPKALHMINCSSHGTAAAASTYLPQSHSSWNHYPPFQHDRQNYNYSYNHYQYYDNSFSSAPFSHPSNSQYQHQQQQPSFLYGPSGYADTSDARVLVLPHRRSSSSTSPSSPHHDGAVEVMHFRYNPYGTLMMRTMGSMGVTKERKEIMANEYAISTTNTTTTKATAGDEDCILTTTKLNDVTDVTKTNNTNTNNYYTNNDCTKASPHHTDNEHDRTHDGEGNGDSTCTEHGDDAALSVLGDVDDDEHGDDEMVSVGERMDSLWVEYEEEEEEEGAKEKDENEFAQNVFLSKTTRGEGGEAGADKEFFSCQTEVVLTEDQHYSSSFFLVNFPSSQRTTTRVRSSSAVSVVSVSASSLRHGSTLAFAGGYSATDDW